MRGMSAVAFLVTLMGGSAALACEVCRPAVNAGIFNESFWGRFAITVLPFAVILFIVAVLHLLGRGRELPEEG